MDAQRRKIINRIRTIKGHLAGIEKMIEVEKPCADVLTQLSAVKSSVHNLGLAIIEENAINCFNVEDDSDERKALEQLMKMMITYSK